MAHDFILLTNGTGTIQAGPSQQQRLDEITNRVTSGHYYITVDETVPSKCIDGRTGANGYAPNAAGGTETLMVADDLTSKRFAGASTLESYSNVLNHLLETGSPIGGHTDDHATEPASGCGANDKLERIYAFIAEHGDDLRQLTEALGFEVTDETHRMITANAATRTEFSPGSELLTVLRTAGGDTVVDSLIGEHKEVVAVINTIRGTTLNRNALFDEFGADYEAFNIDAWAFFEAAAVIAEEEVDVPALIAAAAYYNLATAHVLCGPAMRVLVRTTE